MKTIIRLLIALIACLTSNCIGPLSPSYYDPLGGTKGSTTKPIPSWWWPWLLMLMGAGTLSSCTVVSHPVAGTYASLGGDTKKFNADSFGFSFAANKNAAALANTLDEIQSMWANYLLAEGLKYIAGQYYDLQGAKVDADTSIQLEGLRNAKSLQEAEIKLQELKIVEGLE